MDDADGLTEAAHVVEVKVTCGRIRRSQGINGPFIPFKVCIPSGIWESGLVPECVRDKQSHRKCMQISGCKQASNPADFANDISASLRLQHTLHHVGVKKADQGLLVQASLSRNSLQLK